MLYCEHESLFTRSAAACAASGGSRNNPGRNSENVRGLGIDDQALSQTTKRKRSCLAQSDPRSACPQRSRLAGEPERAVRNPCRCHARRALSALRSQNWPAGESRQHQSCPSGSGLDTKKKTLVAREQDEAARATWREQACQLASQDLVFVDETGSHIAMTPLYAYAPRGQRAVGKVPRNYGANITLLASLSMQGMGEALMLDGAADAAAFEVYIEQVLAPSLRPGQIVILDNLSIHLGSRVKEAIEAKGCGLVFLPAYSPDFSPIEQAFSKLKTFLRRVGARTREDLQEAIAQTLTRITAQDALGWFTHCGYPPPGTSEVIQSL
jgi:transposase